MPRRPTGFRFIDFLANSLPRLTSFLPGTSRRKRRSGPSWRSPPISFTAAFTCSSSTCFPPGKRDPQGIHKAISDEFADEPFDFLPDKPLTVASYIGGDLPTAYVESVAVGDPLPAIPLFLTEYDYVPCPLESSYMQSWAVFPAMLRELMESPAEPTP